MFAVMNAGTQLYNRMVLNDKLPAELTLEREEVGSGNYGVWELAGNLSFNDLEIKIHEHRVMALAPVPSIPSMNTGSLQSREMNHMAQAPVRKKANTMSEDADPTS